MDAGGFTATPVSFRGVDAVRLAGPGSAVDAVVALTGATLLRWQVPLAGRPVEVVDGYRDAAELDGQDGVRSGVMAPFVNRVADGRYRYGGRDHDLLPGRPAGSRVVYHGLLRSLPTTVAELSTGDGHARVVLAASIRPGAIPGYPFGLDLRVRYIVTESVLALSITGHNPGPDPVPFSAGWHPYFTLGTPDLDELELTVPAATVIRTDPDLLPLPGAEAFAPVAEHPGLDFRRARRIGRSVLDVAFAELTPDADGLATTVLRDPLSGAELRVRQHSGLMHVFTGDTLARDPRRSIALEPVEVMTDAFNRPDCAASITLPGGRSRTFDCRVEAR
ncbi:MAG TPA: hypothetical protein VFP72_05090 [Kineosporiaceae bacterium]|nr:hypothetical protein [Kineosporiaceae bacterium]